MEDILFLACLVGVPIAMVASLFWLAVRWVLERRKRQSLGWDTVDASALQDAIAPFPTLGSLTLSGVVGHDGAVAGVARSRVRGGNPELRTNSVRSVLMLPVATGTDLFVRHRSSGLIGRAVEAVAGGDVQAPAHWDWAFLDRTPDPAWDTPERAEQLRALLHPTEALYLTPSYAVIARQGDVLSALLERRPLLQAELERLTTV